MTRSINDVDFCIFVKYCSIFRQNRDSSFTLDVIGIHDTFLHFLILTEDAGLFQQLVYQCCFAVVYVSDDSNITNVLSFCFHYMYPSF